MLYLACTDNLSPLAAPRYRFGGLIEAVLPPYHAIDRPTGGEEHGSSMGVLWEGGGRGTSVRECASLRSDVSTLCFMGVPSEY